MANAEEVGTWQLLEIVLATCTAKRGIGESRGRANAVPQQKISATHNSDGVLTYFLTTYVRLEDTKGESIADIDAVFRLSYLVGEREPTTGLVAAFVPSVTMQAVPFIRELISSLTARMGLPGYVLPLIRLSELTVTEKGQE